MSTISGDGYAARDPPSSGRPDAAFLNAPSSRHATSQRLAAGLMFWFEQNRVFGSYCAFPGKPGIDFRAVRGGQPLVLGILLAHDQQMTEPVGGLAVASRKSASSSRACRHQLGPGG
jgi:hypothetical protein